VLQDLRAIQRWPLWIRLTITGLALGAAFFFQIPLERDWPGEPFLLFLLVVIAATLCFGTRVGLVSVAVSAFLSVYFFEPVGAPAVRYASDLDKIVLYAILALGCVVASTYIGNALADKSDAEKNKSILLREVVHGVANNFAAIAALIQMKSDAISDSKAKSVLDEAIEQIRVMGRVHHRLRGGSDEVTLDSKIFIQELCDDLRDSVGRGRPIVIECKADSRPLHMDLAVIVGLIINELVTNAIKHAFPEQRAGCICVGFQANGNQACLSVEDNGVGFDDWRSVGLGDELVKGLSSQLGGDLQVKSSRTGSLFRLAIPHCLTR